MLYGMKIGWEIDPQPFGYAKDPMAVGNLLEHLGAKPLAEFHHPLLMVSDARYPYCAYVEKGIVIGRREDLIGIFSDDQVISF